MCIIGISVWFFWPKSSCSSLLDEAWKFYRANNQWLMIRSSNKDDGCVYTTLPGVSPKSSVTPTSLECDSLSARALAKELELWLDHGIDGEYCSFPKDQLSVDCNQCCSSGCDNLCPRLCDSKTSNKDILRVYSQQGVTENFCPGYAKSEADLIFHKHLYRSILSTGAAENSALVAPKEKEISCCNPDPGNPFTCLPPTEGQNNCIVLENSQEIIYCGALQKENISSLIGLEESISVDHIYASSQYYKWLHESRNAKALQSKQICTTETPFLHVYSEIDNVINSNNYAQFLEEFSSRTTMKIYKKYLDGVLIGGNQSICLRVQNKIALGSPKPRREQLKLILQMPVLSKYNALATMESPLINPFFIEFAKETNKASSFEKIYPKSRERNIVKDRLQRFFVGLVLEAPKKEDKPEEEVPLWQQLVSTNGYQLVQKNIDAYSLYKSPNSKTEYKLISFEREGNLSSIYKTCSENQENCIVSDIIHNKTELSSQHTAYASTKEKSLLLLRPSDTIDESKRKCVASIFHSFQSNANKFSQITSKVQEALEVIKSSSSDPHIVASSIIPKSFVKTSSGIYPSSTCNEKIMISTGYPSPFLKKLLQELLPILKESSNIEIEETTQNADLLLDFKPAFFLRAYPTFNHSYTNSDDVCHVVYQNCLENMLLNYEKSCDLKGCGTPSPYNIDGVYQKLLPKILEEHLYFPIFWLKLNTSKTRKNTSFNHLP